MSIYERMGEIGTLRALGDRIETIFFQIMLEGLLLGIIGALVAAPLAFAISKGISFLEIPILMPGATQTMPVLVQPGLGDFISAGVVVTVTCVIASFWPAQKALRLTIVEALRANS